MDTSHITQKTHQHAQTGMVVGGIAAYHASKLGLDIAENYIKTFHKEFTQDGATGYSLVGCIPFFIAVGFVIASWVEWWNTQSFVAHDPGVLFFTLAGFVASLCKIALDRFERLATMGIGPEHYPRIYSGKFFETLFAPLFFVAIFAAFAFLVEKYVFNLGFVVWLSDNIFNPIWNFLAWIFGTIGSWIQSLSEYYIIGSVSSILSSIFFFLFGLFLLVLFYTVLVAIIRGFFLSGVKEAANKYFDENSDTITSNIVNIYINTFKKKGVPDRVINYVINNFSNKDFAKEYYISKVVLPTVSQPLRKEVLERFLNIVQYTLGFLLFANIWWPFGKIYAGIVWLFS